MPLHSSGLFSARLRCRAQNRPRCSFGYACGDFGSCRLTGAEKRSLSMRQLILLEALKIVLVVFIRKWAQIQ
jgi:hypothetical protein